MKLTARLAIVLAALSLFSLSKVAATDGPDDVREPIARRTDVYCTGFIADVAPRPELKVIGGERESHQNSFSQGDIVFLSRGRESGVHSGTIYSIIRPLGEVKHPFTKKRLGHFVREIGLLRVIEVHDRTSVAEVTMSCDQVELGDLLRPYEAYEAPSARDERPLPRYGESSGGTRGRIVMSPQFREYLSANQVVYVDLGTREGVRPGDYFTIFRKIDRSERIVSAPNDKVAPQRSEGYGSDHYRGGDWAQTATASPRAKVLNTRPEIPRKVMGEMIILKVEKNASVALITRTNAEVNIGDFIEKSN
jgi:hypothetical protein